VSKIYPDIKQDMFICNMNKTVEKYVQQVIMLSGIAAGIFTVPLTLILAFNKVNDFWIYSIIIAVFIAASSFLLFLRLPHFNKEYLGKKIEAEVAVTGRRLLIQMESGKSLMNSIIDVAKHKKESSKSLERIAYELYMGKPLEQAIQEAIDTSPSRTFRRIFVQIRNSLKTGADLKRTLKASLEEITREKTLEFESFGKKLNPVGLFYMIFGTIAPSLGIVFFIIVLTVLQAKIEITILMAFLLLIICIQFIFIVLFSKMRPELEI
jgi:pilus assembly protein TadC